MSDTPYQVLGTYPAILRGRSPAIRNLEGLLRKSAPDHVSVVGPRFMGKSTLLRCLVDRLRADRHDYLAVHYWDLSIRTPLGDEAFMRRLTAEVREALAPVRPELAEHLDAEGDHQRLLDTIFEILRDEGVRLLLVMDSFERLMTTTDLSRNLWDNVRALAQYDSLRFVTGSQRRLQELCTSEESRTSDFWLIFNQNPIQLGPLGEGDWDDWLTPFTSAGTEFPTDARQRLLDWTGGIPIFAAGILADLYSACLSRVTTAHVDEAARMKVIDDWPPLRALWGSCTVETRAALVDISANAPVGGRRIPMVESGYARVEGGEVRLSCRLMQEYAREYGQEVSDLKRAFGTPDRFAQNIRTLLELRLAQVDVSDSEPLAGLLDEVRYALDELAADEPGRVLMRFRAIRDQALKIVWDYEAPDKAVTEGWSRYWAANEFERPAADLEKIVENLRAAKPHDQVRVFRQINGSVRSSPVSRHFKNPASLLLDFIHQAGNFGQHRNGVPVEMTEGAVFCLAAIELCDHLARGVRKASTAVTV